MIMYLHLSFSTKSPLMNISLNLSTIEYTRPHITSTLEIMIHHLTSFVILFFFNLYISLPLSHTIFHCTITFLPPYLLDLLLFHKKKKRKRKRKKFLKENQKIKIIRILRAILNTSYQQKF